MLVWLSVWSEVQVVCIWSSWCHCRPKTQSSLASFKSRLFFTFLVLSYSAVLEKRPLNGCGISSRFQGLGSGLREGEASRAIFAVWDQSSCQYLDHSVGSIRVRMIVWGKEERQPELLHPVLSVSSMTVVHSDTTQMWAVFNIWPLKILLQSLL